MGKFLGTVHYGYSALTEGKQATTWLDGRTIILDAYRQQREARAASRTRPAHSLAARWRPLEDRTNTEV